MTHHINNIVQIVTNMFWANRKIGFGLRKSLNTTRHIPTSFYIDDVNVSAQKHVHFSEILQ